VCWQKLKIGMDSRLRGNDGKKDGDVKDIFVEHPVIDYQIGSVRDDFNFGHIMFLIKDIFSEAVNQLNENSKFAGLYELRLIISETNPIIRIPEFLYTAGSILKESDEKQFEYVDPKNRAVQIEMEMVFTDYLKRTKAYLAPPSSDTEIYSDLFEFEVSVIIPVKDRVNTISDAVSSVLIQKTDFPFNLIVIDNHSEDGTTPLLTELSHISRISQILQFSFLVRHYKHIYKVIKFTFNNCFDIEVLTYPVICKSSLRKIICPDSFASIAWGTPSLQRLPGWRRPVNGSTIITSPSFTT